MDTHAAALYLEAIKTELSMQAKWLGEADLSDAKPLPPETQYQSSNLTSQPFKKHLVQENKSFKPVVDKHNFQRTKASFGMCGTEEMYKKEKTMIRPGASCFRDPSDYKEIAEVFKNVHHYGKPDATSRFYRRTGAFAATLDP